MYLVLNPQEICPPVCLPDCKTIGAMQKNCKLLQLMITLYIYNLEIVTALNLNVLLFKIARAIRI